MKKSVILFSALTAMSLPFSAFSVSAAEESANIHISITLDEKVLDEDITVKDTNNDGKLTIEDALYTAHEQFYPGGAAAGYSDELIWGKPCSGGYSLINPDEYPLEARPYNDRIEIRDGDSFDWSMQCYNTDSYAFCMETCGEFFDGEPVEQGTKINFSGIHFTMTDLGTEPVEGIELLIDGKKTGIKTDAEGRAAFTLDELGHHTISGDLSKYDTVYNLKYNFYVVPTGCAARIHLSLWTPEYEDHAILDTPLSVYDYDGDGRITSDDAIRLVHQYYGREEELGQNMIWGATAKYVCEVYDDGKLIWSGSAVDKNSESYDLKKGLLVRFRPADEKAEPVQIADAEYAAAAVQTEAVKTEVTNAQTEAVKTEATNAQTETVKTEATNAQTEAATTAATKAAAVQKTVTKQNANAAATPVQAVAATTDNTRTGGAKTGETMPVAALALAGLAAAGGAVMLSRKKF